MMELNHVLIRTKNMPKMIEFFVNTIGLEDGFRPPFPFSGAWLYSGDNHLIHLIEAENGDMNQQEYLGEYTSSGKGIVDHIAFQGADYHQLNKRIIENNVLSTKRTVPLTNELQVFINGPEELVIEMIFPQ